MPLTEKADLMDDGYEVRENYSCIYAEERSCVALLTLHKEFHGYMHLSLIYGEILPVYCAKCPTLKTLTDKLIGEGTEWIESSIGEEKDE